MEKLTLVLASANVNKVREFRRMLCENSVELLGESAPEIELLSLADIGFTDEIVEDGSSFEENALIKAKAVSAKTSFGCISDDSGLEVDALGGEPGIYSARYAGEHGDDEANILKLLSKLSGEKNRSAHFVSSIAYCKAGEESFTVRGEANGKIIDCKRGDGGFGYDPVFECDIYHRTYAELSDDEKNSVSHRRKAIEQLAKRLFTTKD